MTISAAEKLIYLTIGIIFLVLGVVGLVIPILPGVLFLGGALYMLSRGSTRVRQMADDNPTLRDFRTRMDRIDAVSVAQKAQVAALMIVQGTAIGVSKVVGGVRKLFA